MKLGKAFSDSLIVERKVAPHKNFDSGSSWWIGSGRALFFATVFVVAFFVLTWRLFVLTVIEGHKYRLLADGNRVRELVHRAPRGLLLDRTGKPLVANILEYRFLAPCVDDPTRQCEKRISESEGEVITKTGISSGEFMEEVYLRRYLYPESMAHVVGYVGELTQEELKTEYFSERNYHSGDVIGRMGAEATYEERLRGRDGRELVEVDVSGTVLRSLGRQEAIVGEDITLSLDANIAQTAAHAFPSNAKGAVVVSKPATGEILALYSSPSFSPNSFSLGMSADEYQTILENPDLPMFHRAIGGVYPPGSTFKLVTAVGALEEGAIQSSTTVEDTGVITIGPFTFPNWYFMQYGRKEGSVDIVKALQRSNDIFFYKTGEWLGITKLVTWARKLGVGKTLGIELSGEAEGLMPDPTWKNLRFATAADREARNNEWYLGDTYHVSIGQGYLLTTPLQVNFWTNIIANNGKLCRPTIQKIQNPKSKIQNEACKELKIKQETIGLITEGMRRACATGGTGWPLFNFSVIPANAGIQPSDDPTGSPVVAGDDKVSIPVACKTGTAEFGDPQERTHAWFTVFAPLPNGLGSGLKEDQGQTPLLSGEPEISITVLVEAAGEGSNIAAPIAKKILEEWFGR